MGRFSTTVIDTIYPAWSQEQSVAPVTVLEIVLGGD